MFIPFNQMSAKHLSGPTIGSFPALYPYVLDHIGEQSVQRSLRDEVTKLDRPIMMGAPDEAQFLGWLAATIGAKKVLEVGVFRGTTTLAIALALPRDARIIGLEIDEAFTHVGRRAWQEAGVLDKIEVRVGPAVNSMEAMLQGEEGTYDLIFVDADKSNYDLYYELGLRLLRVGGVLAVDNVLWHGNVIQSPSTFDTDTRTIANLNQKIRTDPRVAGVMLPVADGCYCVRKL